MEKMYLVPNKSQISVLFSLDQEFIQIGCTYGSNKTNDKNIDLQKYDPSTRQCDRGNRRPTYQCFLRTLIHSFILVADKEHIPTAMTTIILKAVLVQNFLYQCRGSKSLHDPIYFVLLEFYSSYEETGNIIAEGNKDQNLTSPFYQR